MGWKRNKGRTWKNAQSEEAKEKSKKSKVAAFFRKLIPCCPGKGTVEDASETDVYSICQDVRAGPHTPSSTPKAPASQPGTSGADAPTKTTRRSRKNKKSGSHKATSDGRRSGAEGDTGCQDTTAESKAPTVHTLESNVPSKIAPKARKGKTSESRVAGFREKISEARGDTVIQDNPSERDSSVPDVPHTTALRTRKDRKSGSCIIKTTPVDPRVDECIARQDVSEEPYISAPASRKQFVHRDSLGSDVPSITAARANKKKAASSNSKSNEGNMGVNDNPSCQEIPIEPCASGYDTLSSGSATPCSNEPPKTTLPSRKSGRSRSRIATSEREKSRVSRENVPAKSDGFGSRRDQDAFESNTAYETAFMTGGVESSANRDTVIHDVSYPTPTSEAHSIHRDIASSVVFAEPPVGVHTPSGPDVSKSFHGDTSMQLIRSGVPSVSRRGGAESSITSTITVTSPLQDTQRSEPRIASCASSFERSTFEPLASSDSRLLPHGQYNQEFVSAAPVQENLPLRPGCSPLNPSDRDAAIASLARMYHEIKESIEEEDMLAGKRISEQRISPVSGDIPSGSPNARTTTSTIAHGGSSSGSNNSGPLIHDGRSPRRPRMSPEIVPSIQRDSPCSGPSSPVGENISSRAPNSPGTMSLIQHNQPHDGPSPTGSYIPSWANQPMKAPSTPHRDSPMRPTSKIPSLAPRYPSSWANISADSSSEQNRQTVSHPSPESVSPGPSYSPSWVHNSGFQSSSSGKNASRPERVKSPIDKRYSTLPSFEPDAYLGNENVTSFQSTPISSLTEASLPTRPQLPTAQRAHGFPSKKHVASFDDGISSPPHKNMSPLALARGYDDENLSLSRLKTASTNMLYSRYGRHIQQQVKPGTTSTTDYSARLPLPDGLTSLMFTSRDQSLRSQVRKTAQSYLKPLSSTQEGHKPIRVGHQGEIDISSGRGETKCISPAAESGGALSGTSSRTSSSSSSGALSPTGYPRQKPSSTATAVPTSPPEKNSPRVPPEITPSPRAASWTPCGQAGHERVGIKQDREDQSEKEKRLQKELEDHVNFPPINTSSTGLRGWCLPKTLHQFAIEPHPPRRLNPHYPIMSCGTNHVNIGISYFQNGFEDGSQFKGKMCKKSVEDMIRFAIKIGNTAHLDHLQHHEQIDATHALQIMRGYKLAGELKWDMDDILAHCREIGIDLPEEELPTGLAMEIVAPSSEQGALCNHVAALDADRSEALLYTFERQFMVFLPTSDGRVLLIDVHPHMTMEAGAVILVAPKTTEQVQVMLDGYHKEHMKSPKFNLGQGTKFTYKMPSRMQ